MGTARGKSKLVSKYYRIKLSEEIGRLLRSIPIKGMVETQVGNHVYMAEGELNIGSEKHLVKIRISHRNGNFNLRVKSSALLDLLLPFDTPEERETVPRILKEKIQKLLN
jgi:hypothetical protein